MKPLIRATALFAATIALTACAPTGGSAPSDAAKLTISFADPVWTGGRVPAGMNCEKDGGRGATPALTVAGLPEGTTEIIISYNDESYAPLSYDGGHGTLGYAAGAGTASLPAVPGGTRVLPAGVRIVKENRATGSFATPGYLPPCSGGRGNTYSADVTAVDDAGKILAAGKITLGSY